MKSLRIGMLMCLMFLAVLTLQVQAVDENFNGFTTLNYNGGPLLNYTQANAAPYNTPAGGWVFSGTGSSFGLAPTGGPDGSQYVTRANISQVFSSSFAYVAKVDKALTGTQKIAFDLLFTETVPGNGKGTFCLKVHGINPAPAGGAWLGYLENGGGAGTGGPAAATRYWDGITDAVPADGTRLLFVASSTTSGATLAITRKAGWQHYEFDVNLGTGYEWITINFGHNYEVTPSVAPALVFGVDNVVFPLLTRGQAHTPVPANGNSQVDSTAVTSVSWYSPEQDTLGNAKDDPNIVSVNGYNVYFRTTEPNDVTDTPKSTNQAGKSWTITPALAYDTTYYWRVDTHVTWDSNSFTGAGLTSTVKGKEWQFKTKPVYIAPVVTFNNVRTALPLLPATLAPSITDNTLTITSVTFTLLTDDYEFPAGAVATLTPASPMNLQYPTAALTADKTGKYKVKVVISDGTTSVEKMAEAMVYATTCEARKVTSGWTANIYDRDGDCLVNESTGDLSDFVANWLNDTGMKAAEPYIKPATYVTADILIEAEAVYSTTDPNYVTNPPFDPNVGDPRIVTNAYASGGKIIGFTAAGHFVTYAITIPETVPAGGPYTYTVSVMNAFSGSGRSLALGTVSPDGNPANDNTTAYGSIPLSNGSGYGDAANYLTQYKLDSATINFTAPGTHLVRMTWVGGAANVDYITLKKN